MSEFKGFTAGTDDSVPVPEAFFTELLPVIDDLGELRVTLYAFWNFHGQVREPRYLRFSEILKDDLLMAGFGQAADAQKKNLAEALKRACGRGTLLEAHQENVTFYFLNSERGKAAMEGMLCGAWSPDEEQPLPLRLQKERPNIYALYEQNIGPLTPILSETLQDAEKSYPADWIEDAIKIAVTRNVRNWQYVEAILRSWKEKGRDGTDRKSAEEKRKRD
ncbi:MAG TPA: DnaD domain protein, partial [Anaerolineales bacterium]|nr:DnaD domain protein [Anaerolineales bacterium]